MRNRVVIRKIGPSYSREEKAGFAFITVTASLAIVLGLLYTVRHVASPFDLHYTGPEYISTADRQAREVEAQKTQDTDKDGLSDFDELYVHKTSAYLADTDSDGLSDAVEISSGTDPNCKGDTCDGGLNNAYNIRTGTVPIFDTPTDTTSVMSLDPTVASNELNAQLDEISNLSPSEIRTLLVSSGMSESELASLSDDQLITMYKSVVEDLRTQTTGLSLPTPAL